MFISTYFGFYMSYNILMMLLSVSVFNEGFEIKAPPGRNRNLLVCGICQGDHKMLVLGKPPVFS